MTRDEALKIADRIMRRVEADGRVMHRDSVADELMMRVHSAEPGPTAFAHLNGPVLIGTDSPEWLYRHHMLAKDKK